MIERRLVFVFRAAGFSPRDVYSEPRALARAMSPDSIRIRWGYARSTSLQNAPDRAILPSSFQVSSAARSNVRSNRCRILAAILFLGSGLRFASAQVLPTWEPPPEDSVMLDEVFEQKLDPAFADEVRGLIDALDSPSFKDRKASAQRLIDLGPQVFYLLRDAYRSSPSLELRLQIEHVVREAYLQHFVYGRNAFLGIRQGEPVGPDKDPRIQQGHVGIFITQVIEGTAAEAAGLQAKDVIVEVDGEPIPDKSLRSNLSFGESIRVRGPGARLTLTVLRGTSTITKEVILRSRPKKFYYRQGIVSQMLHFFARTFETFWAKHFAASGNE
ncbi:MAG: PDZ domain-containing protein [Planctomycetota bacterium]|nr:MAG: PDZ domain-containing protein [Planctomycetota bacterium]